MRSKDVLKLCIRYFTLVVLGLGSLFLFYFIFTPLTVYPVYWMLGLFDSETILLGGNVLSFAGQYAQIIPACVAGAAYYLLLILNLTTPMKIDKRVKSIIFLMLAFLALNITRILIFAVLLVNGYQYFDLTHRLTWYFGSTFLVVLVWFGSVLLFKIEKIPVYTDVRNIYNVARGR